MPESDPWAEYLKVEENLAWAEPGSRIIPLPAGRCPDRITDWVTKNLPKNPTPYDMPVFVVEKIVVGRHNLTYYVIHMESCPAIRVSRPYLDIQEKWRPAPKPIEDEGDPVILSRYERPPVI